MGIDCVGGNSIKTSDNEEKNIKIIGTNNLIVSQRSTLGRTRTNVHEIKIDYFVERLLNLHNELRKKYDLPELKVNLDIQTLAEIYAEEYTKFNEKYTYQPNIYKDIYLGENVFISKSKEPYEIFKNILDEEKKYNENNKKKFKEVGHFTQVISKDTIQIGVGLWADETQKKFCTVILYYPPGNTLC